MAWILSGLYDKLLQIFKTSEADAFMEHIIKGEYSFDFEKTEFFETVKAKVNGREFCQQVLEMGNILPPLIDLGKHFNDDQFKELLSRLDNLYMKDEKIAMDLKEKGDAFANDLEVKSALRCYNLAANFSPQRSQCLGLIYAYRALLFSRFNKKQDCCRNIKLAIRLKCGAEMKSQLLAAKKNVVDKKSNPKIQEIANRFAKYRDETIFSIPGMRNPRIPSAIDCLHINYNEITGRYITTDRELKPGTTVIVEDPYVQISIKLTRWDTKHCSNCCKNIWTTIPCDSCVFVSYCSEECRLEDLGNGHQYECKLFPYLHAVRLNSTLHLGIKAICKEGPQNLFKRFKESTTEVKGNNDLRGLDPKTGIYYSDSYHQLIYLKSHVEFKTLPTIAWLAVCITKALDFQTNFFRKSEELNDPEFKFYVASLFLLHGISFSFNVASLDETPYIEIDGQEFKPEHVGTFTFLYPFIALLCHSCDPTVFRLNLTNGKMAVITNRLLQPGDEISFSYGLGYITDKIVQRRSDLFQRYHFECVCIPCSLKWPRYDELDFNRKYLCPKCSEQNKGISLTQASQPALSRNGDVGFCKGCKTLTELIKVTREADRIDKVQKKAEELIVQHKPIEAIPLIIECIEFWQKHMVPPYKKMISVQGSLIEAYALITNSPVHTLTTQPIPK